MHFRINPNLIENSQIAQWPKKFTGEHRTKVDHLFRLVIELDAQNVRAFNSK